MPHTLRTNEVTRKGDTLYLKHNQGKKKRDHLTLTLSGQKEEDGAICYTRNIIKVWGGSDRSLPLTLLRKENIRLHTLIIKVSGMRDALRTFNIKVTRKKKKARIQNCDIVKERRINGALAKMIPYLWNY